jgi:cytochrome c
MKYGRQPLRRVLLAASIAAAGLAAQAAPGDAVRGEAQYARCAACHAMAYDRVGPKHCGLVGRRAGSVAGFEYSAAMKKSGLVWDEKTLDAFLKSPMGKVPNTTMTYDGVPDARDRADLIAYIQKASKDASCRAKP